MKITMATTAEAMLSVWKLTHDAYVFSGYADPQPDGILRHYRHLDLIPETTVFTAEDDGDLLGTISVTEDGPHGLNVDQVFKDLVDPLRASGLKTASVWRLVTQPDFRKSLSVVTRLIGQAVEYFEKRQIVLVLMVVNPKHERFYQHMLCFQTISEVRNEKAVKGNPGILMMTDITRLQLCWAAWKERLKI